LLINALPFSRDVPATRQTLDHKKRWFRLLKGKSDALHLRLTARGSWSPELDKAHDRFTQLRHLFMAGDQRKLKGLDLNLDGRITLEEFIESTRWMRLSVASLRAMDTNQDGRISLQEFQGAPLARPFILGTDNLGRDILTRLLEGLHTSVLLALLAGVIALFMGVVYGMAAGYAGGWVGAAMMRLVDVVYGLPYILLVVVLIAVRGPGFFNLLLAVLIVQWLPVARVVRTLVLSALQEPYVLAARGMGAGSLHILRRHILPQVFRPALTLIVVLTPNVIRQEVLLSFLGLGITPPQASLGNLISDSLAGLEANPLAMLWPTLALVLLLLGLQVLDTKD